MGGLLLGPLGAVTGGVTAKKSQTNNVKSVALRIIANDTAQLLAQAILCRWSKSVIALFTRLL